MHHPQATITAEIIEALRNRYEQFDNALKFVQRRRLPTCKCEVLAMPSHGSHEGESFGYSNGHEHVAAAICAALEAEAEGEEQWEVNDLNVLREGGTVYLRLEYWDLIWFRPLTDYEIRKVRAEYRKARRWQKRDPWNFGQDLYPYMPGSAWEPLDYQDAETCEG